jgi:hypothetical protein
MGHISLLRAQQLGRDADSRARIRAGTTSEMGGATALNSKQFDFDNRFRGYFSGLRSARNGCSCSTQKHKQIQRSMKSVHRNACSKAALALIWSQFPNCLIAPGLPVCSQPYHACVRNAADDPALAAA